MKNPFVLVFIGFIAVVLLSPASVLGGLTIHVPGDFHTIQAAIDNASKGSIILVADGIYLGEGNRDIDFNGKAIILESVNGPESTVIMCNGTEDNPHRGFYFHSGEWHNTEVRGFTISNCFSLDNGGAVKCVNASPLFENCVIERSHSDCYVGGGFYFENSQAKIINCIVRFNHGQTGGGLYCKRSTLTVEKTLFLENLAYFYSRYHSGGGICGLQSDITVNECVFLGNVASSGAGISVTDSCVRILNSVIRNNQAKTEYSAWGGGIAAVNCEYIEIANCEITGNSAKGIDYPSRAGGVYLFGSLTRIINCTIANNNLEGLSCERNSVTIVINSIIWGNYVPIYNYESDLFITFSDVETEIQGEGNISLDPLFTSGPSGDYYLGRTSTGQPEDSPCIDAGSAPSEDVCFGTTPMETCMDSLTTATDLATDIGGVDLGFHYPLVEPYITPVQVCIEPGCELDIPNAQPYPGDEFICGLDICNPTIITMENMHVFVLIEIHDTFLFAPGFSDFDYYQITISPGITSIEVIPPFTWPSGFGSGDLYFHAAAFDQDITGWFGAIATSRIFWYEFQKFR